MIGCGSVQLCADRTPTHRCSRMYAGKQLRASCDLSSASFYGGRRRPTAIGRAPHERARLISVGRVLTPAAAPS